MGFLLYSKHRGKFKKEGINIVQEIASKRTFEEIRNLILITLATGQKTINQIATDSEVNWKTVTNHLVYLQGRMLVKEVFTSPYVRIFELTAFGKHYLRQQGKIRFSQNKIISHESFRQGALK